MARDAQGAPNVSARPDPVELVEGPDRGDGYYWCADFRTLQTHHRELSARGVPCVECGHAVGAVDRVEFASLRSRLTALAFDLGCAAALWSLVDFVFVPYQFVAVVVAVLYMTIGVSLAYRLAASRQAFELSVDRRCVLQARLSDLSERWRRF